MMFSSGDPIKDLCFHCCHQQPWSNVAYGTCLMTQSGINSGLIISCSPWKFGFSFHTLGNLYPFESKHKRAYSSMYALLYLELTAIQFTFECLQQSAGESGCFSLLMLSKLKLLVGKELKRVNTLGTGLIINRCISGVSCTKMWWFQCFMYSNYGYSTCHIPWSVSRIRLFFYSDRHSMSYGIVTLLLCRYVSGSIMNPFVLSLHILSAFMLVLIMHSIDWKYCLVEPYDCHLGTKYACINLA